MSTDTYLLTIVKINRLFKSSILNSDYSQSNNGKKNSSVIVPFVLYVFLDPEHLNIKTKLNKNITSATLPST